MARLPKIFSIISIFFAFFITVFCFSVFFLAPESRMHNINERDEYIRNPLSYWDIPLPVPDESATPTPTPQSDLKRGLAS